MFRLAVNRPGMAEAGEPPARPYMILIDLAVYIFLSAIVITYLE